VAGGVRAAGFEGGAIATGEKKSLSFLLINSEAKTQITNNYDKTKINPPLLGRIFLDGGFRS